MAILVTIVVVGLAAVFVVLGIGFLLMLLCVRPPSRLEQINAARQGERVRRLYGIRNPGWDGGPIPENELLALRSELRLDRREVPSLAEEVAADEREAYTRAYIRLLGDQRS